MGNKSSNSKDSKPSNEEKQEESKGITFPNNTSYKLKILPLNKRDIEISDLLQDVFISVGITLDGYLSLSDFYNLIQSGFLGTNWQNTFPQKTRISHCLSLDSMNAQIISLLSDDEYTLDANQYKYNASLSIIDIKMDELMDKEYILGYIAMYFVAIHLWCMTDVAQKQPQGFPMVGAVFNLNSAGSKDFMDKDQYILDQKENGKHYKFPIKSSAIKEYFAGLNVNPKNGFSRTESRIDYKFEMIKTKKFTDIEYKIYPDVLKFSGGDCDIKSIDGTDIIGLMLPGFLDGDDGEFIVVNISTEFVEKWERFETKHQFIFQRIGDENGLRYKLWMNGGTVNRRNMSLSWMNQFLEVWGSVFINHPLIGVTLRQIWDESRN